MRLPIRRGEQESIRKNKLDLHLTPKAIERLKHELKNLEKNVLPEAAAELRRTAEMGDLSENAAYQFAKDRLRGINNRIASLKTRITQAIPITGGPDQFGRITTGSTVTLSVNKRKVIYEIVGAQETSPGHGRISHSSPLGSALLGHKVGDTIAIDAQGRKINYKILEVA